MKKAKAKTPPGPMSPDEYQSILDKLELTQVGMAALLKLGDRTSRRYASGDAEIPTPTAKLLRLMVSGKISIGQVEKA